MTDRQCDQNSFVPHHPPQNIFWTCMIFFFLTRCWNISGFFRSIYQLYCDCCMVKGHPAGGSFVHSWSFPLTRSVTEWQTYRRVRPAQDRKVTWCHVGVAVTLSATSYWHGHECRGQHAPTPSPPAAGTCMWTPYVGSQICTLRTPHMASLACSLMCCCSTGMTLCSRQSSWDFKIQRRLLVGSFSYPLAPGPGHSISWTDLHINWTCSVTHLLKLICFTTVSHYLPCILQQAFNFSFHIVLCFIMFQCYLLKFI